MNAESRPPLLIAISLIESSARDAIAAADSLEDKLRAAMKEGHRYWMSTDDYLRLQASVGAVLMGLDRNSVDAQRLLEALRQLRALGAMLSGVPVDVDALSSSYEGYKPIYIYQIWEETRE